MTNHDSKIKDFFTMMSEFDNKILKSIKSSLITATTSTTTTLTTTTTTTTTTSTATESTTTTTTTTTPTTTTESTITTTSTTTSTSTSLFSTSVLSASEVLKFNKCIVEISKRNYEKPDLVFTFLTSDGFYISKRKIDEFEYCDNGIYNYAVDYFVDRDKYNDLQLKYKESDIIFNFCYCTKMYKKYNKDDIESVNDFMKYIINFSEDSKSKKYICKTSKEDDHDTNNKFDSTITNNVFITKDLTVIICSLALTFFNNFNNEGKYAGFVLSGLYTLKCKTFSKGVNYTKIDDVPEDIIKQINSFIPVY